MCCNIRLAFPVQEPFRPRRYYGTPGVVGARGVAPALLISVLVVSNACQMFVPRAATTAMLTTAIKATMRAYSTIVAPSSSVTKRFNRSNMWDPFLNIWARDAAPARGPRAKPDAD